MTTVINVKDSAAPADTVTPELMLGYVLGRRSLNRITDVPGRGEPVVSMHDAALSRSGRLEFLLADEAAAVAFDKLISRPELFTLTDSDRPFFNLTFALDDSGFEIKLDPDTRRRFVATVNVREVPA